jgi:hypothetical protein
LFNFADFQLPKVGRKCNPQHLEMKFGEANFIELLSYILALEFKINVFGKSKTVVRYAISGTNILQQTKLIYDIFISDLPQFDILSIIGNKVLPYSDILYSTLGGISA